MAKMVHNIQVSPFPGKLPVIESGNGERELLEESMVTLAGVEPATCGLGNRRSIHLSYRATSVSLFKFNIW
jgi:hypothetical protein